MDKTIPVEKNQVYTIEISGLGSNAEGVGRLDGYAVFVPGAIPGDVAQVKILKVKKHYAFGKIEALVTPSANRVDPPCPLANRCGGCSLQHMTYDAQKQYKTQKVQDDLNRIGGFSDLSLPLALGMERPFHYRNKAQFPVGGEKGKAQIGFFAPRSHRLIPVERCLLQHEAADRVLAVVQAFLNTYAIEPYDELTHRGLVRHVLSRVGFSTGEIMVCLVLNGKKLPHSDALITALQTIPGMTSIVLNENKEKTNVILGRKTITLWGKDTIRDCIGDLMFDISPLSFFQVNPTQTKVLYETALAFAGLTGTENVLDIYCGIGTISLFFARKAKSVLGVEIVPQAIEDAKKNAALNGIANVEFIAGKAEEVVPALYAERGISADVIVVDPPRKGCEVEVLQTMLEIAPEKIVYVSCDPATLARDLKMLCEKDYRISKVQVVDQFCQTSHCETCVLLERN